MRRRLAIVLASGIFVAACGGGATPTPSPGTPTPEPTDIFVETPEPSVAPLPTEGPVGTEAPAGQRYKVKKGDTMWAIAQEFGVSLAALKAANPDVDPQKMAIGTILVIPAP
jgi:LysM repeat protein